MIRVMVVDDEPLALQRLLKLIGEEETLQVIATASNGEEALRKAKQTPVDLMFLDVEMPGLNGLEVASRLASWEKPPLVVFVTAYEKYAMEAFDKSAVDYVIKPVEPTRFKKAVGRVLALLKTAATPSPREKLISLEDQLIQRGLIKKLTGHEKKSKDRIIFNPEEVYYFFVSYSEVYAKTDRGDLIVKPSLKDLMNTLDPDVFAQTHKSYLVNINKIQKVAPLFHGSFEIILNHPAGLKIPLSKRFSKNLRARFKW